MAFVSDSGYTAVASRIIYTDSATSRVFKYMELGFGDAGVTTDATLATACTASDVGLTRATLATASATTEDGATLVSGTHANDTCWFRNTWTCGVSSIATGIKECGVFNSNTGGDMLAYGTFPTAIPMGTGDTLQVTWSVTVKSG
jgi:hypothetical protein